MDDEDELQLQDDQKLEDEETPENEEKKDGESEEDELELSFGDEPPPSPDDSSTIRQMRERLKESSRRIAELEAKVPPPPKIDPGPRPTLEGCEWDEDRLAVAMDKWYEAKNQAQAAESEQESHLRKAQEAFQADATAFDDAWNSLKIANRDQAETVLISTLKPVHLALLKKLGKDGAPLAAALGLNPGKLAEIANMEDPMKAAFALGELKGKLKVSNRKPPAPEQVEQGTARVGEKADAVLERLEKKAERTGDRTEIAAYKASLRTKR